MKLKTSLQLSAIFPILFAMVMALVLFHRAGVYTQRDLVYVVLVGVLGLGMAAVILSYSKDILSKIKVLNDWINAILKGNLDAPLDFKPSDDEVGRLSLSLSRMLAELKLAYSDLHKEAVTHKKSAEDNKVRADMSNYGIRQLTGALDRMKDSQKDMLNCERMRVLEQVTRGVSHDFSEALTPILGSAELMRSDKSLFQDSAKGELYIDTIMKSVDKAKTSIANLAGFFHVSKEQSGPANVSLVVKDAIALTEPYWRHDPAKRGLKLDIRTKLALVPAVAADPTVLRNAICNIIINAVDAIFDENGTIEITSSSDGNIVAIEVSDSGRGMSPDVLNRCLEPFFTTKIATGAGMGLTNANSSVKRYGGVLSITSREAEGTCVRLELPIWLEEGSSIDLVNRACDEKQSLSVLLIDDDPGCRDVMTKALEYMHNKAEIAVSGQDGLEKLRGGSFDLVIVDRAMPGMTGDEFVRIARQTYSSLPIIMLTGFGSIMTQEGDVPKGINALLSKPIKVSELNAGIQKVMRGKTGGR